MHRVFAARACVRLLVFVLSACMVDALLAQYPAPLAVHPSEANDALAALRMQEQFKILKDLTAAYDAGPIPPRTSATVLRQRTPRGLRTRIEISRPTNFSLSMDQATGQIFYPPGWDSLQPHGGPPVDCTGSATLTVLARELSSHEIGLGDMNCDGALDNGDVSPLALAMVDPAGYAAAYAGCNPLNGDLLFDGVLNGRDITPFVERLLAPVASDVPVRLRYRLGAGPYQDLMAGQDVLVNDSDTLTLTQGQELVLAARMAWPGFAAPTLSREVLSDSATHALILVDGDNYTQMALAMEVQNPYGSQLSVAAVLGSSRMNATTGEITLADNEAIVLYELGTTNVNSPAYDMQDLVLLVTTDCDIPQEVVLRDSIGATPTSTHGNAAFGIHYVGSSAYSIVPAEIIAPAALTLTSLRTIVAKTTPPLMFDNLDYNVRIWSSMSAAINQPNFGNIDNIFMAAPTTGPTDWGSTGNFPPAGVVTTYEMTFDISAANITLNSGQLVVIGISVANSGCNGGQNGCLGILETNEIGDSDTQISSSIGGGWRLITSSANHRWDGRVAWDIRGLSN